MSPAFYRYLFKTMYKFYECGEWRCYMAAHNIDARPSNATIRPLLPSLSHMFSEFFPNGFTRYLIGGSCIGLGIALLFIATGRMGGVSTFFSAAWSWVLRRPFFQQAELREGRQWRLVYSLGLALGGALYLALGLPQEATQLPAWKLALGGLLIGFGARLGGGCTSGHGICGMASLSPGSIAMVGIFLTSAMLTANLIARLGSQ